MTQQELLNEIQILEEQKQRIRQDQKKQIELLEALKEFQNRCSVHVQAFNNSMEQRRNRLSVVDGLVNTVKAAACYRMKMGDMLNGAEFQNAAGNIEALEKSVDTEIQNTESNISEQERDIRNLQRRIEQLRYQISLIPEEDSHEQQK